MKEAARTMAALRERFSSGDLEDHAVKSRNRKFPRPLPEE